MRQVVVRRWSIAAVLGALIVFPAAGAVVGSSVNDNCHRIHGLYIALDRIIADNNTRIDRAVREGLLTPAQGRESRGFNEQARAKLREADCPAGRG